jgi:ABC-type nitrate/sulfonate/bicarbonate transport system substrate-binding protein
MAAMAATGNAGFQMPKFIISPHMRLHEWVAEEKGYFRAEGLDYEFQAALRSQEAKDHDLGDRVGAYQTFERGRTCDVSSACHWTVNIAAAAGHGRIYVDAYSVAPCAIFVARESGIERPEDLAGVPISVGYQSGSHYSTIEALDQFLEPGQISLSFAEGLLFSRMEQLIEGRVPAVNVFSGPYYFLEQLGFRKVLDTSFMMAAMVSERVGPEDVRKYYAALRRAQADIDLHPHRYTHHYKKEFPQRYHASMDTRLFGPGERIVFEPYTRAIYEDTQRWIMERGIFPEGNPIIRDFDRASTGAT